MNQDMEIRMTDDGSHTLYHTSLKESYHSLNGAIQESLHVFIQAGFNGFMHRPAPMNILEIGMGTGLNLLLTYLEAGKGKGIVDYIAIEPNPVPDELLFRLNYIELLEQQGLNRIFDRIHAAKWNQRNELDENFFFTKIRSRFEEFNYAPASFDLIYFDAFSPGIQPELWTVEVFSKMASLTKPGGVLVTYSAKGLVRRNLERAGFSTERLPGPKGKREILRARYL